MSELGKRLDDWLGQRSERERWIILGAGCVLAFLIVLLFVANPMQQKIRNARNQNQELSSQLLRTERTANELRSLRNDLKRVEERIKPGEKTNLLTLLEKLAADAAIKDQLESVKPKQASGNALYPETRVEVSIRGATLKQTVQFLHQIETASVLLIVRSLRIKTRDDAALDVSFSVSSFERG